MWHKGTPRLQKKLDSKEALSYKKFSIGGFKSVRTLAGCIPVELSRLIDYFLEEKKENLVSALVMGSKKPEVGLAGPAFKKQLRVATILLAEILKIKTKHTYFELTFEKSS